MASVPVTYPASLPTPSEAPTESAERRVLDPSLLDARAFQRDRLAYQSLVWYALTREEALAWDDWWKNDLSKGGMWFAATWPLPEGQIEAVRRFIGTPRWEFIPKGYWRIAAEVEVRGVGEVPAFQIVPLLAMHFDEDFTDESGHTIAPYDWTFGNSPPEIEAGSAKFGAGGVASNGYGQPLISDTRGSLNLNEFGEWQIRFWANPTVAVLGHTGGAVISLQGAVAASGQTFEDSPPGGAHMQLAVSVETNGSGQAKLLVRYLAHDFENPGAAVEFSLNEPTAGSNDLALDGEMHFFVVCGDATSTRAYIDGAIALDDHDGIYPAGSYPLFYDPAQPFTDQAFIVLGAHSGLTGLEPGWPGAAVFTQIWNGDLDDLEVINGVGVVEFTGNTIDIPSGPF